MMKWRWRMTLKKVTTMKWRWTTLKRVAPMSRESTEPQRVLSMRSPMTARASRSRYASGPSSATSWKSRPGSSISSSKPGAGASHELLVIRSELGLGEFPIVDGAIPEDTLDIVDEIEEFASESWASIALDLKPGRYILLCNIVEIEEDGTLESHFELGMRVPFIVR